MNGVAKGGKLLLGGTIKMQNEWKKHEQMLLKRVWKITASFPVCVRIGIIYMTLKIENAHKKFFLAGNLSA